jgi:NB-ARC domain/TIR domain
MTRIGPTPSSSPERRRLATKRAPQFTVVTAGSAGLATLMEWRPNPGALYLLLAHRPRPRPATSHRPSAPWPAGLDRRGELRIGDSIIERIASAINEVDFFIVPVSEVSRVSRWCRKELALAVAGQLDHGRVTVLPLCVDGALMPDALLDIYYLNLDSHNIGGVAAEIVAATRRHASERAQPMSRTSRQESHVRPALPRERDKHPRGGPVYALPPLTRKEIVRESLSASLCEALTAVMGGESVGVVTTVAAAAGGGGFGKTTVARWVCHRPAIQRHFSDGIVWIAIGADATASRVVALLNDVTGLFAGERPSLTDPVIAAGRLREVLTGRRVLLVVDDVRSRAQLESFLQVASHGPRPVAGPPPGDSDHDPQAQHTAGGHHHLRRGRDVTG